MTDYDIDELLWILKTAKGALQFRCTYFHMSITTRQWSERKPFLHRYEMTLRFILLIVVYISLFYASISYQNIPSTSSCQGKAIFAPSLMLSRQRQSRLSHLHGTSSRYSDILDFLRQQQKSKVVETKVNEDAVQREKALVETIVRAADGKKAIDITVIDVQGVSDSMDYIIIMEGNSKPQIQAILSSVEVRTGLWYLSNSCLIRCKSTVSQSSTTLNYVNSFLSFYRYSLRLG